MRKYPLIGVSICAVVLIVLASLTNVVGYQTVQASNQKIITTEINPKNLLFQTIVDMANNKEIQRIIVGSESTGKKYFDHSMMFSALTPPLLTKRSLNLAYHMGLILSKTIRKSTLHSMLTRYKTNRAAQNGISVIIERTIKLKNEINQVARVSCDCENETTTPWDFPIICGILILVLFVYWAFQSIGINLRILGNIWTYLFLEFNCMY